MKADRLYRALWGLSLALFVCILVSSLRWLVKGFFPLWIACCQMLNMSAAGGLASWPAIVVISGIALVGSGVLFNRLWKTFRFMAQVDTASAVKAPDRLGPIVGALGLSADVVVVATEVPVAFCFGLLRPRICLSTGLAEILSDQELGAVLLHEDYHRQRRHPLHSLLADVLAAVLFFVPAARELRDLFLTAVELEADRHATRAVGRPALAGALHKMLTHPLASRFSQAGAAAIRGLSPTQARLDQLLSERPPTLRLSTGCLMASAAVLTLMCLWL
jgi:hypothetical protein